MHFIYTNNDIVTHGDLSIIPKKYKKIALEQKKFAISSDNLGLFCPPVVVGIGKAIQYIV